MQRKGRRDNTTVEKIGLNKDIQRRQKFVMTSQHCLYKQRWKTSLKIIPCVRQRQVQPVFFIETWQLQVGYTSWLKILSANRNTRYTSLLHHFIYYLPRDLNVVDAGLTSWNLSVKFSEHWVLLNLNFAIFRYFYLIDLALYWRLYFVFILLKVSSTSGFIFVPSTEYEIRFQLRGFL